MKKILTFVVILGFGMSAFAQDVNKNIQNAIKEVAGIDTKILSVDKIESVSGMAFAVVDGGTQIFPLFVSTDGKSIWAVPQFFKFSNQKDESMISKRFAEVEEKNTKLSQVKIDELFNKLPKEAFINIDAKVKTDKLLTIVTEPDCPYCRNELNNLENHLEETNIRIVFASVHDKKAFVKAKLILDETKKLKPTDSKKIIEVFKKYYKDVPLSDEQMKTDISIVEKTTNEIFGSGLIRGVPYLHKGTK